MVSMANFNTRRAKFNYTVFIPQILSDITPEQRIAITDLNPLMSPEINNAFNIAFDVEVQSYAILKSIIKSDREECDQEANEKADRIIKEKRDKTIECMKTFRDTIFIEAKGFEKIMDVSSRQPPRRTHRTVNLILTDFRFRWKFARN